MTAREYETKARLYLEILCCMMPDRRTGSPGNRMATTFFAGTMCLYGYVLDTTPFACLDHAVGEPDLIHAGEAFEVHVSPYSLGCDVRAELVAVSTEEELASAQCQDQILLMRGPLCAEQLMPKEFVFYNPEHHQRIVALLECKRPAAIITATGKNPALAGALSPFPLIHDGDFDIPSVYCSEPVGDALAGLEGAQFHLKIEAQRIPATANNVIARLNPEAERKVVVSAHIDTYEGTPGAVDNASGTVVLLLLAEMLAGYGGALGVELVAFNGEDHYSAGGEMDYLRRYGAELPAVLLAVNIDGVAYHQGHTAYSWYECPSQLEQRAEEVFSGFEGLVRGKPWYGGDHMVFVQKRVPALAFTSEPMAELTQNITHTAADTPDLVDCAQLVEIARALDALVRAW
jgi:aminopeptidase YwaD